MRAIANAKVNLCLRVGPQSYDGLHEIRGLFQSVEWSDLLEFHTADEDAVTGLEGEGVIDGFCNLAWQALLAVRSRAGSSERIHLILDKAIPIAAGLGGGSADAAAALALAADRFGIDLDEVADLAPDLGSDVPFCLVGGKAIVTGSGERVDRLVGKDQYGLALIVPPIELSTATVFAVWDQLEDPKGLSAKERDLPPALRNDAPLINDLYPAAIAVAAELDEWRAELSARWDRPVLMTGSGPTLFGFFVDVEEAGSALANIPRGVRAAKAVVPVDQGWELLQG